MYKAKIKSYSKNTQSHLKMLKEDYFDTFNDIHILKGTVLYNNSPVELTDKSNWDYQIKTTGDLFSGNFDEMITMLNQIFNIVTKD